MLKLNKRQSKIYQIIREKKQISNKEITSLLMMQEEKISRFTVIRDLDFLIRSNLIEKIGQGRSVIYQTKEKKAILQYIDVGDYFMKSLEERNPRKQFNFDVYENLVDLFSQDELDEIKKLNLSYQKNIKSLPPTIKRREFERLTIDLSWKSSQIEGNTYSLLETEILLKEQKQAEGKKQEEATMIINHKDALDFIRDKKSDFKKISIKKIENIHALLTKDLRIGKGIRKRIVGITGTNYRPLDNEYQIREALENLVKKINSIKNPIEKAMLAVVMISYIQAFEDGNKRTGRILGNAILMAYNICPLSYRSVKEIDYKMAVLLFYEQNNISFFKKLFIEQYEFAVGNYFLA